MVRKITVVVPTLNSGKTLDWTLLSLVRQRNCQITVIIVDSGSSDDTSDICDHWQVRMIYEPPGNMYRAINAGLRLATTSWVTYLNSDDMVYPCTYARLIDLGESTGSDVAYGSYDAVDSEGRFIYSYYPGYPDELRAQFLRSQLSFAQPAAIFTRQLFVDLNGFDVHYRLAADLDFFARSALANRKFVMLSGPTVAAFRVHRTQSSQDVTRIVAETRQIQSMYGESYSVWSWPILRWRIRNWSQYLQRVLRHHAQYRQWRIVRTMDAEDESA